MVGGGRKVIGWGGGLEGPEDVRHGEAKTKCGSKGRDAMVNAGWAAGARTAAATGWRIPTTATAASETISSRCITAAMSLLLLLLLQLAQPLLQSGPKAEAPKQKRFHVFIVPEVFLFYVLDRVH